MALEVIEELCYEMGLHKLEAVDEYAIFLVTNRGEPPDTKTDMYTDTMSHSASSLLSVKHIHSWITYQCSLISCSGRKLLMILSPDTAVKAK